MKKSWKWAVFTALVVSSPALASPTGTSRGPGSPYMGHWMGQGQSVMNPNSVEAKVRNCSDIELNLDQDTQTFYLDGGSYTCQDLHADYGSAQFEIRGHSLWYQGQEIGTITRDQLSLAVQNPNDGVTFKLTLTPDSDSSGPVLEYLEQWVSPDNQLLLQISGKLTPN